MITASISSRAISSSVLAHSCAQFAYALYQPIYCHQTAEKAHAA